jgi:hypothetical protein
MENTTQQETKISFCELRKIFTLAQQSVKYDYLRRTWKQEDKVNNYRNIVKTESGYYAFEEDCVVAEDEYYHEVQDADELAFDEIDECYILSSNAIWVSGRAINFYTHENNCNERNEIYRYNGEYITEEYMQHNELVFDCDGDIVHRDNVYYWECDGEYHHGPEYDDDDDCNDDDDDDDDSDMDSACINSYSYRPSMNFHKLSNENENAPFFGIELEVERKNSNGLKHKYMAGMIKNEHWYFKTDGSLTDGFEIVTHPLTFNYIQQSEKSFTDSLKLLVENGYNSYDANTCGMHIHISKANFTTWHLYRFLKFFVENKEFIVAISQRKMEKLKKWANIEDDNDSSLIYKAKKKDGNNERYVAINLQNKATLEIRIFRGTLNINSFMKNIEFAHALFMYTKENKEISLDGFKMYIQSSCDYSNLKKFINLKNL